MIKQENRELNGETFCVHFSDSNKMIRKEETGATYEEAWDTIPCRFTYTETDIDIETTEPLYRSEINASQ